MVRELKETDPLFKHLGHLLGLNLVIGTNFETAAFGWKHNWKRLVTALLSFEGLVINGVHITNALTAEWFELIEGHDWTDMNIWTLFNHNDKQDVPRAITLLSLITDLRDLDHDDYNPSQLHTFHALQLLGEMYRLYRNSFIPSQLFGDLQCMFKDAIFAIARMKELNPMHKVFFCLLGDDVLEVLFGRVRMIGGHDSNADIDQLRHRLASAIQLDKIFSRHPELERKPRRLNTDRTRSADHFSPCHWTDDLTAESCDLTACWKKGVEEATICLQRAGHDVNFDELLCTKGIDLMRPHGDTDPKSYPGVDTKDVDRSLDPDVLVHDESDSESSKPLSTADGICSFDGQAALDQERREAQTKPHSVWMPLSSNASSTPKLTHKKTILCHNMNPHFNIDQAASRAHLIRVQAYSTRRPDWDLSISNITNKSGGNVFCVGHLFAALITMNDSNVSLAIINCTLIRTPTGSVFSVPLDKIILPNSKFDLSGQVLALVPDFVDGELVWNWQAKFIEFESGQTRGKNSSSVTHLRNLKVTVNGSATRPLQFKELALIPHGELSPVVQYLLGSRQNTWRFTEEQLSKLQTELCERASLDDDVRQEIPLCNQVRHGSFPYLAQLPNNTGFIQHVVKSISIPPHLDHVECVPRTNEMRRTPRQSHLSIPVVFAEGK
ncbi:hypothetical protein H0H81_010759 [Sphagnurus paluster]|uniref:Uncharacterized protein n=1 Tax=Sphagnurus paluster TaxID=117069 RepID=A0A9P7FNY9_9AGAR|nr:hypothetical protein H0H81_010759 [Sphagnurus paluster]